MRTRIAVVAFLLLMCSSVIAAEKPGVDIPLYPGGESTMEINLTSDDLLPTLQAMLPMMAGKLTDKIDFNDLAAALKDVKSVQFLQVDIKKTATETEVTDFYAKKMPAGDWNRVFWQKSPTMGTVALYVQGQGEKLYGFRVTQEKVDDKPVKRVAILKTDGKIDYVKLLAMASKFFTQ